MSKKCKSHVTQVKCFPICDYLCKSVVNVFKVYSGFRRDRPRSLSCFSSTSEGASTIRQVAFWVFGNAMTSLISSSPKSNVTILSSPNAKPPCGGAPYWSASSKNPNLSCAVASSILSKIEDLLLDILPVYSYASASQFHTIQDQIIGPCPDILRTFFKMLQVVRVR